MCWMRCASRRCEGGSESLKATLTRVLKKQLLGRVPLILSFFPRASPDLAGVRYSTSELGLETRDMGLENGKPRAPHLIHLSRQTLQWGVDYFCSQKRKGRVLCTSCKVKVAQLCPALCDPIDYRVHGIL